MPVAHLDRSDPAAWDRVVDINYKGVYHGMHAALQPMLQQGAGVIVNVSSGAATSPLEGWSHYCSTKAAVLMLTRCADLEVRIGGIGPLAGGNGGAEKFVGLWHGDLGCSLGGSANPKRCVAAREAKHNSGPPDRGAGQSETPSSLPQ